MRYDDGVTAPGADELGPSRRRIRRASRRCAGGGRRSARGDARAGGADRGRGRLAHRAAAGASLEEQPGRAPAVEAGTERPQAAPTARPRARPRPGRATTLGVMTSGTPSNPGALDELARTRSVDALLVYVEPLCDRAFAVVIGDAETHVAERLLELGARGVHVFDPDPARAATLARQRSARRLGPCRCVDDLDVRDGAFDLAVIPDLAELNDPPRRDRAPPPRGRDAAARSSRWGARGCADDLATSVPFVPELGPARSSTPSSTICSRRSSTSVSLAGVVPFRGRGVRRARREDEALAVSVDTRLGRARAAERVRRRRGRAATASARQLDPYAIVQVRARGARTSSSRETTRMRDSRRRVRRDAAQGELLLRSSTRRASGSSSPTCARVEAAARLDRLALERDAALTRAMELEAVLAASQQAMATLERRLLEAEQGMLERDDRIAALSAELDARQLPRRATRSIAEPSTWRHRPRRARRARRAAPSQAALTEPSGSVRVRSGRARRGASCAQTRRGARSRDRRLRGAAPRARARHRRAGEGARSPRAAREGARASLEELADGDRRAVDVRGAPPVEPRAPAPPRRSRGSGGSSTSSRPRSRVARASSSPEAWRITELENERARRRAAEQHALSQPGPHRLEAELEADRALARDELDALRQALDPGARGAHRRGVRRGARRARERSWPVRRRSSSRCGARATRRDSVRRSSLVVRGC